MNRWLGSVGVPVVDVSDDFVDERSGSTFLSPFLSRSKISSLKVMS